ncbi:MAG: folylpolyglutamate synthase/dihydrofolate synthase family protein [Chlamydiota bacterium]
MSAPAPTSPSPGRPARGVCEAYLSRLERFGMRPGLDRIRLLLGGCGDPQRSLSFIQVAGTNGKGSVCAMVESVLRAAGFRTGLYTSPHLVTFRERIRLCGEPVGEEEADSLAAALIPVAERVATGPVGPPTYFEFMTAMAFLHFVRQGADFAVIETGLGGRLDATTASGAPVAAITSIGLEHTAVLGDTIAAIAAEKAGIIAEGASVVCGEMPDEAFETIMRRASEKRATVLRVGDAILYSILREDPGRTVLEVRGTRGPLGPLTVPLAGRHQAANCAVACGVVDELRGRGAAIDDAAMVRGIAGVRWPGRMEILSRAPLTLVDCAHNPDGARAAAGAVAALFPGLRWALVLGALEDKDAGGICEALGPLASAVFVTPVPSGRSADPGALAAAWRARAGTRAETAADPGAALGRARRAVEEGAADGIFVTGSIYLVGDVMRRMGATACMR